MNRDPELRGHYAGFASRAGAIIIDALIIVACVTIGAWLVSLTMSVLNLTPDTSAPGVEVATIALVSWVPMFIAGYYALFWSTVGKTPGKALLGLKVVRLDGSRLSFGRSLLRVFGYTVSTIFFGLGYAWVLIDNRRMGWHDKIARTCVIYDWDARPLTPAHLQAVVTTPEEVAT